MSDTSSYVAGAIQRAKRRRSKWNLLLAAFTVISIGLTWYFLALLLIALRNLFFPDEAFLVNGTHLGNIVVHVLPFFPSLGIGLMIANLCVWLVPPARRALDREASGSRDGGFKASNLALMNGTGAIGAITLPLAILGATSYFYLTRHYVAHRTWIFGRERHYAWSEVAKIETACWYNRGSQDSYTLVMRDGTRVGILESHPDFFRAYPEIASAVSGGSYVFDSSRVERGCYRSLSPPWRQILTSKPDDSLSKSRQVLV